MKKLTITAILLCSRILAGCFGQSTPDIETQIEFSEENREGIYLEYSETALEEALESNKTVVLFFHADWCPTCAVLDEDLNVRSDEIPENTIVLKTDYDSEQKLRQEYGVTIQHTLVQLDSEGEIHKKWVGGGIDLLNQEIDLSKQPTEEAKPETDPITESNKNPVAETTVIQQVDLASDFTGAKIDEKDLLQGCFKQDCIPSIQNPTFENAETANSWLNDEDIIFAINYKEVQRAYPQGILNWHEIVNDEIAGDPIAITFCPLCGSAVAFERKVNGVITELGVSGKLHNSDLVMYDRYEGNLWQQISGEGIVGPAALRDEVLKPVAIATTTWGEWKEKYPKTEVLTRESGGYSLHKYSEYPYGTYEQDDDLYFKVGNLDTTLQIKTVVYGIEINGEAKAYPESAFEEEEFINDNVGDYMIQLSMNEAGEVDLIFKDKKHPPENIAPPTRLFWFAWASFHPDTQLYQ